jgi:hypothetical protein
VLLNTLKTVIIVQLVHKTVMFALHLLVPHVLPDIWLILLIMEHVNLVLLIVIPVLFKHNVTPMVVLPDILL